MSTELQEAWNELQTEIKPQKSIDKETIMQAITIQSKNPLEGLRKGLNIKRNWCLLFSLLAIVGLVASLNYPEAMILWVLALAYFGWGYWSISKQIKQLDTSLDKPIKPLLESYYQRVSQTLSSEEGVGAFTIPLSVIFGYALSSIYKGESMVEAFSDPSGLAFLLIATILFGAGGLLLAQKMNKKAFGKYLEQLKTNIDLLNAHQVEK